MSVDCEEHHRPIWEAVWDVREKTNKLPLWAKIMGGVIGVVVLPIALGLGSWALRKCDALGERVRAVEVKSDSTDSMLTEIRGDVKELLKEARK